MMLYICRDRARCGGGSRGAVPGGGRERGRPRAFGGRTLAALAAGRGGGGRYVVAVAALAAAQVAHTRRRPRAIRAARHVFAANCPPLPHHARIRNGLLLRVYYSH